MDWAKAKSILIFVFLGLNIFLVVNLGINNIGGNTTKEAILSTLEILKGKGVILKCEIPVYSGDIQRLNFEGSGFDRSMISSKLLGNNNIQTTTSEKGQEFTMESKVLIFKDDNSFLYKDTSPSESINVSDKSQTEKYLRTFLSNLSLPMNEYYLDEYTKNADNTVMVAFKERYNKFLVFDNSIKITASKNGITNFECSFKRVKELITGEKPTTVPAYQILLRNFSQTENTVISDIWLGWYLGRKIDTDTKIIYAPPVWRIRTESGIERFFNAYTGVEVK